MQSTQSLRGQAEPEAGQARLRLGSDPTTGRLYELLDDRQPDAVSAADSVARLLHPIEALEDVRQVALWDGIAGIGDGYQHITRAGLCRHGHRAAGGGVARRVLQQVGEDLRQLIRIGASR